MYNFPQKDDLIKLIGKELQEISCAVNLITFSFSGDISISTESNFSISEQDDKMWEIGVPINSIKIFELLGSKVSDLAVYNQNREMKVAFSSGQSIVFTSSEMYEDVQIIIENKEFRI